MIELPPLPYAHEALAPYISAQTLKLHHGAHHRGYVDKLNGLIKGSEFEHLELEAVVARSAAQIAAGAAQARPVFNNAAQAWNHAFFWNSMCPPPRRRAPAGDLAQRISADFGGFPELLAAFKAAAGAAFGSAWLWLVESAGRLKLETTANADTPLARGEQPLLVVDLWEHAYYLDHQNRRDVYVAGVVEHLLNWPFAEANLAHPALQAA